MSTSNSVDIVHAFWDEVWNAHDPAAVDRFVVDGLRHRHPAVKTITGARELQALDRRLSLRRSMTCVSRVVESFQNADGSRGRLPLGC